MLLGAEAQQIQHQSRSGASTRRESDGETEDTKLGSQEDTKLGTQDGGLETKFSVSPSRKEARAVYNHKKVTKSNANILEQTMAAEQEHEKLVAKRMEITESNQTFSVEDASAPRRLGTRQVSSFLASASAPRRLGELAPPNAKPPLLELLGKLFINPATPQSKGFIQDDVFGFMQVLFLGFVYGYIWLFACDRISTGAELMQLVPSSAGVVSSVVLPVLGAVPDAAILLFSGLGDKHSIGFGALAGSTVMLLTMHWFLVLMGGRVPVIDGRPQYDKSTHDQDPVGNFFTSTGVAPHSSMKLNVLVMLITCLPYLTMEIPALALNLQDITPLAWAGSVFCLAFFVGYLLLQFSLARRPSSGLGALLRARRNRAIRIALSKGICSKAALLTALHHGHEIPADLCSAGEDQLQATIQPIFKLFDKNGDGKLCRNEIKGLLDFFGKSSTPADLDAVMEVADVEKDELIDYEEFLMLLMVALLKDPAPASKNCLQKEQMHRIKDINDEKEVNEPTMPSDLKGLPRKMQQDLILWRALGSMGLGTLLVLLFSDPLIEILWTLGERSHIFFGHSIPVFYISFLILPLGSNAAEMISSYKYALKRDQKSITISFSQLLSAVCMNNTFCLMIFYLLIALHKQIDRWRYHAEVIGIVVVEILVALVAICPVQLVAHGIAVLSLLPLCLATVVSLKLATFKIAN